MKTKYYLYFTALTFALITMTTPVRAEQREQITNISTAKLNWKVTDEGVAFASLIGDRFAEPYMAMVRLPAGLVSPPHIKTANMFGIVVSGTMRHVAVGADSSAEVLLPAGSFYKIPAGLAHVSKCNTGQDCITFLYQDGKFDFLPTSR